MSSSKGDSSKESCDCSIPLIDFSPFLVDDDQVDDQVRERQRAVARQIDEVNRNHGFLALINFGITEEERTQAFGYTAALFDLPDDYKRTQLPRIEPSTNLGYAPVQSERLNTSRPPEMKEAFNIKFPPAWKNDYEHCCRQPEDAESFGKFWDDVWLPKFQTLARRFAVACAMALQLDAFFFTRNLERFDRCTLRSLHYPPCDWDDDAGHDPSTTKTALRIGEHTDFGMFTFLLTNPGPDGLQFKSAEGAEVGGAAAGEADGWQDVVLPTTISTPQGDSQQPVLIVNTGALLARWTNDEWKATAHRVIVPNAEVAGRSRYSMACFIDPDQDSMVEVHPSFAKDGKSIQYEPIKSSDYLTQKLQSMMKKAS